jgi:hypothetical protein
MFSAGRSLSPPTVAPAGGGRLAAAQADIAEIKAAKLRGELVEAARLWKSSGQACFAQSVRVCSRCRVASRLGCRA